MNARRTIVVFLVDGQRYALPLSAVDRAVRAVAVTPLPEMPPQVLGAINVHGRVLPVLSLRRWLGRPVREIRPFDELLIAHTAAQTLVLVVDEVCGVAGCEPQDAVPAERVLEGAANIGEMLKLEEGLVLLLDLDRLLTGSEADAVAQAWPAPESVL